MKQKVLVIGDAMLDVRRFGRCTRTNPESAGCKVLDVEARQVELGGAANVARWLAACPELDVALICHYSEDTAGRELAALCEQAGVFLLTTLKQSAPEVRTTVKERLCQVNDDQIEHLLRVDSDTNCTLTDNDFFTLINRANRVNPDVAAVVIADYRKSVFMGGWGDRLRAELGHCWPNALKVVNSKCPQAWANVPVNYLVCNDKEALQSWPVGADNHYEERVRASFFVKTEGPRGATVYSKALGSPQRVPSLVKTVVDVTGAGDAFVAGLTRAALRRMSIVPLETGSIWAAHCCGQIGCGTPIGGEESENVNMQLLGWVAVNGLCYNGQSIYRRQETGELAYEDMNHQCRLGALPSAVEALIEAQL